MCNSLEASCSFKVCTWTAHQQYSYLLIDARAAPLRELEVSRLGLLDRCASGCSQIKKKHLHKNTPEILHPYPSFTNFDAILSVHESGAPAPRGWKSAPVFPNVHKIKVKGSSWYEYSFVVLQVQGNQFLCQFCRWTGINSFAGQPILIYNTAPKRLVLNY